MTNIESLIKGYQEASERLREKETALRWNYGEDIRKFIRVRAVTSQQHVPFTICPGEKRVRIGVDEICAEYMVCDKDTGQILPDWSITLT